MVRVSEERFEAAIEFGLTAHGYRSQNFEDYDRTLSTLSSLLIRICLAADILMKM